MNVVRASVAVPRPVRRLFTYVVPPGLEPRCRPGVRVLVPFGRRRLTGYLLELLPPGPAIQDGILLKPIDRVLDDEPLLDGELLGLTRWAADYYAASWGEVLRAALPGMKADVRRTLALTLPGRRAAESLGTLPGAPAPERGARAAMSSAPGLHVLLRHPSAQAFLTLLAAHPEGLRLEAIRRALGPAWRRTLPDRMVRAGLAEARDVLAAVAPRPLAREVAVLATTEFERIRGARQCSILRVLTENRGRLPTDELLKLTGGTHATLRSLAKRGVVRLETEERPVPEPGTPVLPSTKPPVLTAHQARAFAAIGAALADGGHTTFLLHGVTGSGKTEVYLQAISSILKAGRRALYLVPEIALTPLLARRLSARLGAGLAVVHSRQSDRDRAAAWRRIRSGGAPVVLGARSAVFAPLPDLGLIVVDEEHDASYKQEESPRYHGRDLAVLRASRAGIPVVLGSATPSIESYYQALRGKYRLLELPERVGAPGLPPVERVDMRREFRDVGRESVLSRRLEEAIEDRLRRGEQAIILLNRRGFSTFLLCRACGEGVECRHCSIAMTLHLRMKRLLCHYCGADRRVPQTCPKCGSRHLHFGGTGTERLEEILKGRFPGARLARMDRDTVRGHGAADEILTRMEQGDIDILFGTQMIAKGHDFPNVTLVGVLAADALLGLPDFRAGERTFQLLAQVAGRSGRGERGGEVIVQAFDPEHHAIRSAAAHDYPGFARHELAFRRITRYPPYCALAAVLVRDRVEDRAHAAGGRVAAALRRLSPPGGEVLGPATAPIARLRGSHRVQVLARTPDRRRMQEWMAALLEDMDKRRESAVDLAIDVDPVSTL